MLLQKANKNKTKLGTHLVLWLWNNSFFLKKKHGLVLALDLKNQQDQ